MKKKLLLLNALLGGLLILGGGELYRQYVEAEARYGLVVGGVEARQAPRYGAPDAAPQLRAASYLPAAERLLFSPDRNPEVIVVEAEPEPIVRPDLPRLNGVAAFGGDPTALMSPDADTPPSWVGVGEKVGAYVFQAIEGDKIRLSWNGEEIVVAQAELSRAEEQPKKPAKSAAQTKPSPAPAVSVAAQPPPKKVGGKYNIGTEFAPGRFRGDPKDDSPDGTVFDGKVKRVRQTPFGAQSWWEAQGR